MTEPTYPLMRRCSFDIEVPRCRNGRPGYAWVSAWEVMYGPAAWSQALPFRDAQQLLREAKKVRALAKEVL